MIRLLLTVFFFEAGLVLVILPWSGYWERNYFAQLIPWLQTFLVNDFVRGAVSGLGLVNVLAAIGELADMFGSRPRGPRVADAPGELGDHHAP